MTTTNATATVPTPASDDRLTPGSLLSAAHAAACRAGDYAEDCFDCGRPLAQRRGWKVRVCECERDDEIRARGGE